MLPYPIEMINQGILTSLVENQVAESRDLEFKQVLPGRSDEQVSPNYSSAGLFRVGERSLTY